MRDRKIRNTNWERIRKTQRGRHTDKQKREIDTERGGETKRQRQWKKAIMRQRDNERRWEIKGQKKNLASLALYILCMKHLQLPLNASTCPVHQHFPSSPSAFRYKSSWSPENAELQNARLLMKIQTSLSAIRSAVKNNKGWRASRSLNFEKNINHPGYPKTLTYKMRACSWKFRQTWQTPLDPL